MKTVEIGRILTMTRHCRSRRSRTPAPAPGWVVINKLVNCVMLKGKKAVAARLVRRALNYIKTEVGVDAFKTLCEAVDNVTPYMEVRALKVGGVSYQIPIDVAAARRLGLALRWLVSAARQRKEAGMEFKLAWEIIDSALRRSASYRRRESVQALADANQAFSHMGW
ncbi:MAG: 30S ribosomal protein S7 [Candidatus Hodgkinia cicadicola]